MSAILAKATTTNTLITPDDAGKPDTAQSVSAFPEVEPEEDGTLNEGEKPIKDNKMKNEKGDEDAQRDENKLRESRRETFAIKTNLLEWGAYVPQYGMCPMPNVEIEYLPLHGHWTVGASFDCPWWKGNIDNHKYFQIRNYQIHTRYYLRNSNRSYIDVGNRIPKPGQAAYRGFYLQAYAHAFLYQIGFSESKGWVGEGAGAGLGIGYVLPLSRDGHWRLDFGVQGGIFITKYDPYVYGCPVENIKDGMYYYDYIGEADLFKKREYRLTWLGPTRVSISISYDLFYKRNHRRGVSFNRYERRADR